MDEKQIIHISKFLSKVLRHQPQLIGLQLDEQGWVSTEELLSKMKTHNKVLTLEALEQVVEKNNKKRFAFNEDKTAIRANQGHSININLGYEAIKPPQTLYHGTANRFLKSIKTKGIVKGRRHHVHLSKDEATAINVGNRHGKAVVLIIDTQAMHKDGHAFFVSENDVWLTDKVPAKYIENFRVDGN